MKLFYIFLGFLSLILGAIGVILPGLPTTPFLLLALFCFGKGSERLRLWFLSTKLYRKYLKSYDESRAMTMKQKLIILATAFPFCLFAFFTLPHIGGKICLVLAIIFQYWYFFFKIKTLPEKN